MAVGKSFKEEGIFTSQKREGWIGLREWQLQRHWFIKGANNVGQGE